MEPSSKSREIYGRRASLVGILANLLLAGSKIAVGALFGAVAVLADGINNLTDCGSSLISLLSFRLSSRPADREHPFGHERIEYIASSAVAVLILLVAFETAKEAFDKILHPSEVIFSYWTVGVLLASILVKCVLYFYNKRCAAKIGSDILAATATDCLTDCISTLSVLLTLVIALLTGFSTDGYAGLFVALFIAYAGIGILRETASKLIGQAPDDATVASVAERILAHEGVLGLHDLQVYSYGPNKYFASVHIEVDADVDVLSSHELIDLIEREFATETTILLTGHLDPIVVNDERVNSLREAVSAMAKEKNPALSVHDFRMVFGEKQINVLFDVAVPFGLPVDRDALVSYFEARLAELDSRYRAIITVEHTIQT